MLKQKTAIIEPYINAFETVREATENAGGVIAELKSNEEMCPLLTEEGYAEDDDDTTPFYFLGNCNECSHQGNPDECPMQKVLLCEWNTITLTSQKLRALTLSKSEVAKKLLQLISQCDNLIIDEASSVLLSSLPQLKLPLKLDNSRNDFGFLSEHIELTYNITERIDRLDYGIERIPETELWFRIAGSKYEKTQFVFWTSIEKLATVLDQERERWQTKEENTHTFRSPLDSEDIYELNRNFHVVWQIIRNLGERGKLLWDMLPLMLTSETLHIQYIEKPSGKEFERYHIIKPLWSTNYAKMLTTNNHFGELLRLFSRKEYAVSRVILEEKRVIIADSCLPDLEFATGTFGDFYFRKVKKFIWGDPLKTNEKQLIICDTRQIDSINFFENGYLKKTKNEKITFQNYVKNTIEHISDVFDAEKIFVVAMNKNMCDRFGEWKDEWKDSNKPYQKLELSYYGSNLSRGITPFEGRNILVLVGGPYIPKDAFEEEVISEYFEKSSALVNEGLSQRCRSSHEQGSMVNILGRVKDQLGLSKSIVFALGVTEREMSYFVKVDDVLSPHVTAFHSKDATAELFVKAGQLWQNNKYSWEDVSDVGTVTAIIVGMNDFKNATSYTPLSTVIRCREKVRKEREKHQEKDRQIVKRNKVILEDEGLEVIESNNGGYSFKWRQYRRV
jgi:menaquinone-dependent protoporphyrinogen IX oxidase